MNRNTTKYYRNDRRGFANEYTIAIATTQSANARYSNNPKWHRITRVSAIKDISYDGDAVTEAYNGVEVNGDQPIAGNCEIVRAIRNGTVRELELVEG